MKKLCLSLALSLLFFLNVGYGQIAAWQLNGKLGGEVSINATTLDANLNTSTLSRASGINFTNAGNSFSSTNFTVSGTKADAISSNKFVLFTINTKSGYKVSLSTLDARFRRSSTGPNTFRWQYSIDGTTFTDIGSADISYTLTTSNGDAQTQIALSAISALQNVTNATTITIRLLCWGASNTGGTFGIGKSATSGSTDYSLSIGGTVSQVIVGSPTITTVGLLNQFNTLPGTSSVAQSYRVSGDNLTDNITITPPANFELSQNGYDFSISPIILPQSGGKVGSTQIFVRFTPLTEGISSGNVADTSAGADPKNISVIGSTIPTITTPSLMTQFYATVGTSSVEQADTVSGVNLIDNITITPPRKF